MVEATVLGGLEMYDELNGEMVMDYKVLAAPTSHVRQYESLEDVDQLFLKVCKNFFAHYKDLNETPVQIGEWQEKESAMAVVKSSLIPYKK